MDSEKSNNWKKKDRSRNYLWEYFFRKFVNNFSALLLWIIYVFGIFNMVDFFSGFFYIAKYWNSDCTEHLALRQSKASQLAES